MNMNISIEEMRTAVLDGCERLCPHSNDERIGLSSLDTHYILPIEDGWWLIRVGATKCTIGPDCDLDAMNWLCAYRLLGLESKAKDAEIERLRNSMMTAIDLSSDTSVRVALGLGLGGENMSYKKDAEIARLREGLRRISLWDCGGKDAADFANDILEGGTND